MFYYLIGSESRRSSRNWTGCGLSSKLGFWPLKKWVYDVDAVDFSRLLQIF